MTAILIGQIITAILLVILIIPQGKGGGIGSAFGSTTYHTRRGIEKGLFTATIITAVIFILLAIISLVTT